MITDGEVRRESYILHFCRAFEGFDFHKLFSKICRDGAVVTDVPCIVSDLTPRAGEAWVRKEWKASQGLSALPMKMTLPGPMTIINSTEDQYYNDEKVLGRVLAQIINSEIKALASAGCKYIQVFDASQISHTTLCGMNLYLGKPWEMGNFLRNNFVRILGCAGSAFRSVSN